MGEGSLPSLRRLAPAGKGAAAALCDGLVGARGGAQNCAGLEIDSSPSGYGATMAIRRERTHASGGGGPARLRRPGAAWLAALALVLQLGFGGVSHWAAVGASAAELAVTALRAAVGREVSLCAEGAGGHSGAPDPSDPCCDDCALCVFACHSAALAPQREAAPFALRRIAAAASRRREDADATPPLFRSNGRPRAPPLLA
ncbi:MAG TPA: DUF2946 family protein [Roseiarcus sp.]|nr:DUF2946 family protein [Roseiarcus sp.]